MRNKFIRGIIVLTITGISILSLPIGANAEWKQNRLGYWLYTDGNSYTEGNSYATGWRYIDGNRYYFSKSGYMETGWVCDGYNWYYLNQNGHMVSNQIIDGYHLNSSGVCTDFISAEDAKGAMFKEDGVYVNPLLEKYGLVIGDNSMISILSKHYGINEEVYAFYFQDEGVIAVEFVGVKTKNVYRAGSNGGCPIYLVENNTIIKQYNWID